MEPYTAYVCGIAYDEEIGHTFVNLHKTPENICAEDCGIYKVQVEYVKKLSKLEADNDYSWKNDNDLKERLQNMEFGFKVSYGSDENYSLFNHSCLTKFQDEADDDLNITKQESGNIYVVIVRFLEVVKDGECCRHRL